MFQNSKFILEYTFFDNFLQLCYTSGMKNDRYYIIYTAVFTAVAIAVYSSFLFSGRSFIWHQDGVEQHFNALAYFGRFLREFLLSGFTLPMFDFSIGLGSDVLTVLHYYVIGDPLTLLAVFVPASQTELLYNCLVVLRVYLAGIAFSAYCRLTFKPPLLSLLCGALLYAFCGYALLFIRHPFFLNPLIYLPFLLLGIENVISGKRSYLLIFMVFLSAVSNFYFFYKLTILAGIYILLRWPDIKSAIKISIYYVTGVLLAGMIFLPVVMFLLSTARQDAAQTVGWLYPLSYYLRFLPGFIVPIAIDGYYTVLGFTPIALVAVVLLFTAKGHTVLKVGFVLLTFFHLLPIFGHIFNGFSYPTHRWNFGYAFLVSLIVVVTLPRLFEVKITKWAALPVTIVGIVANAHFLYSDYSTQFMPLGSSYYMLTTNASLAVQQIGDPSFYRFEENRHGGQITGVNSHNFSILNQENGTSFAFSLNNPAIGRFRFDDMQIPTVVENKYFDWNARAALGALSSVKYFVVHEDLERFLPYGYTESVMHRYPFVVYENHYALPLGYTYLYQISNEEYRSMSSIERQQALLLGAVVYGEVDLPHIIPEFTHIALPFEIYTGPNIWHDDGTFYVEAPGMVWLHFDGPEYSEIYLSIQNLHIHDMAYELAQITIETGDREKVFTFATPDFPWFSHFHDFLLHLGFSESPHYEMAIYFHRAGRYTFDNLQVYAQPMEDFGSRIDRLREVILEDVTIRPNRIAGTIESAEVRLLVFSIPYNGGWRAYVNGERAELHNINTMFMGVAISEGHHHVLLAYRTPFLLHGMLMSLVGLLLFLGIILHQRRRNYFMGRRVWMIH